MYFTKEEWGFMRMLARNSVEFYIAEGQEYFPDKIPDKLKSRKACFVTINKDGGLRGCIGNIIPSGMLYQSIIDNAVNAATRDPRFPEVSPPELKSLSYEITVLSEPIEIKYISEEELFKKIIDKGVIIKKSFYTAVYLPQVWKHFNSPAEFLSSLCRKASLHESEWKKLDLKVSVFESVK